MNSNINPVFKHARISKDRNFNGVFYFAVKTTGIFCRPSCPSPIAREENVIYFDSIFEALESGYRPCHRCRPDLEYYDRKEFLCGADKVNEALHLIYNGYLNYHTLPDLAGELCLSDRYLRKLFVNHLGLSPVKIARYHKLLFAKRLLLQSNLKISQIVYASGFGSIRQFNDAFKSLFEKTPTELRRDHKIPAGDKTVFILTYDKPFHFKQMLSFMRVRGINGVELISDKEYSRTFRIAESQGYFTVRNDEVSSALILTIVSSDIRCYMEVYNRVRIMFDLDRDFSRIRELFLNDAVLNKGMVLGEVPRLPVAFNTFEFAVRAVLGQQITVKAATTLAGSIAAKANLKTDEDFPVGLDLFFPSAEELTGVDFSDVGITKTRFQTLHSMMDCILAGKLQFSANQSFDKFHRDFSFIKGIGDWTVNYVAMRGLGMMDAFPAADLGIIKALSKGEKPLSVKLIEKIAEKWKPYRSYAALCLWNLNQKKE